MRLCVPGEPELGLHGKVGKALAGERPAQVVSPLVGDGDRRVKVVIGERRRRRRRGRGRRRDPQREPVVPRVVVAVGDRVVTARVGLEVARRVHRAPVLGAVAVVQLGVRAARPVTVGERVGKLVGSDAAGRAGLLGLLLAIVQPRAVEDRAGASVHGYGRRLCVHGYYNPLRRRRRRRRRRARRRRRRARRRRRKAVAQTTLPLPARIGCF